MLPLLLTLALALHASAEMMTLTQEAKDKFVSLHNDYRAATGADMPKLTWSDTLEQAAIAVGSPCEFAHPQDEYHYGENIFITSRDISDSYTLSDVAADAASNWQSEIKNVDDVWDCICNGGHEHTCGHYSQEVWSGTTEIGCSVNTQCEIFGGKWTLVFCEYNPQGNMMTGRDGDRWIAQPPY